MLRLRLESLIASKSQPSKQFLKCLLSQKISHLPNIVWLISLDVLCTAPEHMSGKLLLLLHFLSIWRRNVLSPAFLLSQAKTWLLLVVSPEMSFVIGASLSE